MSSAFRCPECGANNHVFSALNESLLVMSGDLATEAVLEKIVDVARRLVNASYGAVGVGDDRGGFSHFITSLSGRERQSVPLPAAGPLARVIHDGTPYTTTDVSREPGFSGWPDGYPSLKSFLGVPIVSGGEIVGAFYIGNENTWGFTPDDQALLELLAPHAGLAIKNARLHEQGRQLSIVQERNRLARELHDSVTQTMFSMKLAAESASQLIEDNTSEAREHLTRLQELARHASEELRSLVFELRPAEVETEGLLATVRKHVDALRRVHPMDITLDLRHHGDRVLDPLHEKELFRIIQEALNNAIRHSGAGEISVEVFIEHDKLRLAVADDGAGFDPAAPRPSRRLGLVSMAERAQALGGELSIASAPGSGTVVALELRS